MAFRQGKDLNESGGFDDFVATGGATRGSLRSGRPRSGSTATRTSKPKRAAVPEKAVSQPSTAAAAAPADEVVPAESGPLPPPPAPPSRSSSSSSVTSTTTTHGGIITGLPGASLECPLCRKGFAAGEEAKRVSHLKACGPQHGLDPEDLLKVKRLQERQAAEWQALGLPNFAKSNDSSDDNKNSRRTAAGRKMGRTTTAKDRRDEDPGSLDPGLEMALALSASLAATETEVSRPWDDDKAVIVGRDLVGEVVVAAGQESLPGGSDPSGLGVGVAASAPLKPEGLPVRQGPTGIAAVKAKAKGPKFGKVSVLETRTEAERQRQISDRVASILAPAPEDLDEPDDGQADQPEEACCPMILRSRWLRCRRVEPEESIWRKTSLLAVNDVINDDNLFLVGSLFKSWVRQREPCGAKLSSGQDIVAKARREAVDDLGPPPRVVRKVHQEGPKPGSLASDLLKMLRLPMGDEVNDDTDSSADLAIYAKDEEGPFLCHSVILRARCKESLASEFILEQGEGPKGRLMLCWSSVSGQAVALFLQYLYGDVMPSPDLLQGGGETTILSDLTTLAKKYRTKPLLDFLTGIDPDDDTAGDEAGEEEAAATQNLGMLIDALESTAPNDREGSASIATDDDQGGTAEWDEVHEYLLTQRRESAASTWTTPKAAGSHEAFKATVTPRSPDLFEDDDDDDVQEVSNILQEVVPSRLWPRKRPSSPPAASSFTSGNAGKRLRGADADEDQQPIDVQMDPAQMGDLPGGDFELPSPTAAPEDPEELSPPVTPLKAAATTSTPSKVSDDDRELFSGPHRHHPDKKLSTPTDFSFCQDDEDYCWSGGGGGGPSSSSSPSPATVSSVSVVRCSNDDVAVDGVGGGGRGPGAAGATDGYVRKRCLAIKGQLEEAAASLRLGRPLEEGAAVKTVLQEVVSMGSAVTVEVLLESGLGKAVMDLSQRLKDRRPPGTSCPPPMEEDVVAKKCQLLISRWRLMISKRSEALSAEEQADEDDACVTPKPDFDRMGTPEVRRQLRLFGLRATLPKSKAVKILDHIYEETHPAAVDRVTSRVVTSDEDGGRAVSTESGSSSSSDDDDDDQGLPEESLLCAPDDDDDDEVFPAPSQDPVGVASSGTPKETLGEKVLGFIQQDRHLTRACLTYEPIWLEAFFKDFKAKTGTKCSLKDIMDILDGECITFRTGARAARRRTKKTTTTAAKKAVLPGQS